MHSECFVCFKCGKNINGPYGVDKNKFVCATC